MKILVGIVTPLHRGFFDLDKISQTGAEWHVTVDCGDVIEIETRCRIPIWWTFGRIQCGESAVHQPTNHHEMHDTVRHCVYTWQFRYDESWYFGIIFATTWHALVHLQWPASLPTLSRVLPSLARILPSVRPSRSCPVSKREHIRNLFHRLAAMPVAGRFATLPVCHLDVSLPPVSCDPRRFATWTVRHLDVSHVRTFCY